MRPVGANSTQGRQGRLASLRTELLPPLPPCRTPRPADRYRHESCRLPVRRQSLARHRRGGGSSAMTNAHPQELGLLARLVIVISILLFVTGVMWHGVTVETFPRIWNGLI